MAVVNLNFGEDDVIVIKAHGDLSDKELVKYTYMALICKEKPCVLWDLAESSVNNISSDEIVSAARQMNQYDNLPEEGKMAFVVSDSASFGILRMFEAHLKYKESFFDYSVFQESGKAKTWLMGVKLS